MASSVDQVQEKIKAFQKRYYLNLFVRGSLLTLSILCGYFLMAALLEHVLWLGPWIRLLLFFSFFSMAAWCVYRFLKEPLQWWFLKKGLNDEQSARIIGSSLPAVQDRLLNFLQLRIAGADSALAYASIEQRSKEFEPITFDGFIDLRENRRYLKFLAVPLVVILIILITNQAILTRSTDRILHFTNQYSPEAPFQFVVEPNSLSAFYNEDITITLRLTGEAIPENTYIVKKGDLRLKMERAGAGEFTYVVEKIQEGFDFQFEAAGFYSAPYHIAVERRPELTGFTLQFEFPRYLNRKPEAVRNSGNAEIPEGTKVTWLLQTGATQKATIAFKSDSAAVSFQPTDDQNFTYSKRILNPDQYEIQLGNDKGANNKEKIAYTLDVIKDEFPKIVVGNLQDSILYKRIVLGGNVSDDYGISDLALHFRIRNEQQQDVVSRQVRIALSKNVAQQSFYYNWNVDSLKLKPGQQLEYYLEVWDNDGVNGRKSTKSASYQFLVPSSDNLVRDISKSQSQTQSQIDKSVNKANNLQDQIEQANQKLKGKNSLDWQDKKMLEDIIQNKKNLDQVIEQMREENKLLEQKKEAFTEQDERIKEKAEQIQKLMDQLLDEETKKLFEELQKLMKENTDVSQLQKILDKLNQNSNNLEKELERTLELFKQLQFDYKLDQTINDLKEQVKDQQELLEKTEALDKKDDKGNKDSKDKRGDKNNKGKEDDKANKDQKAGDKENQKDSAENKGQDQKDQGKQNDKNQNAQDQKNQDQKSQDQKGNEQKGDDNKNGEQNKELAKEQERLKEEMKKTSEQLDDLKKLGEELNKNEEMPPSEQSDEIMQEQQQSQDQLNQNSPDKAKSPQQKALKKMQQMQQSMEGMQDAMEMQMEEENLEALRQIIHGLVKLSFDQEGLMKNFGELQQSDPRFNTLAQQQLKLKDDAKVLEDSLLALGKRDPAMGGFINKEISELNNHLDKVIEANKERKRPQAANEMQLSMTSINNLALMLDDHFDMMMQMMANAKPSMKKSKQKGQKPSQSLSQLQQQLNQKINDLKGGKKTGRELSEQLAEMAAEQERIRRAVQEMEKKMNEQNGGKTPGSNLAGKMEQTETELVNKQLTDQMIRRQQEILTRLLETEKSAREQDMDDERKGETAKDYEKEIPKAFEEYLRLKEKEVELLKTVPPKLYPYYKKEVSEYFKRMNETQSAQPK